MMAAHGVPVDHSAAAPPSAYTGKLQHTSPLDTLVRRTSSRRVKQSAAFAQSESYPAQPVFRYDEPPEPQQDADLVDSYYAPPRTPPRLALHPGIHPQHLSPSSPLLHGHFTRDSTATASSDNRSYLDVSTRSSVDSRNVYQDSELEYRYYDSDSVYSEGTALRDSWRSAGTTDTARPPPHLALSQHLSQDFPAPSVSSIYSDTQQPPSPIYPTPPTVIVSTPPAGASAPRGGRAPIVRPITSNYSRPARAAAESVGPLPPPPPPSDLEEQKRRVLERNATRRNPSLHRPSAAPSIQTPQSEMHFGQLNAPAPSGSRGTSPSRGSGALDPRSGSPASLYSNYSYYPYNSAAPSPVNGEFRSQQLQLPSQQQQQQQQPPPQHSEREKYLSPLAKSSLPVASSGPVTEANASTPEAYLQLGIQHHEANRLKESAIFFEKSAKEGGGCGVGMLMWGLALRHGWGCEKNEKTGFKWLRNAAESAVVDLEAARRGEGVDPSAVQTELVLAIYEVGQCFFHGWGVAKDQKMGVSYYSVAARLGDADAQSDLAFCLANGKGCKKDRREAAKWYRAAVAQGQSDIGLAWIYKEKYQ